MRMPNSLLVAITGGFWLVVVLGLGLVNDRLLTAESQVASLNSAALDKISRLDVKNEALIQQVANLQNNFENIRSIVDLGEHDVQSELIQMMAISVEEAVAAAIEDISNSAPGYVAMKRSPAASGEQEVPSPEQVLQYEDILMWLKDPGSGETVTFRKLEARALLLPLSLQKQVLRDIKLMVNNGEIDVDTFF